MRKTKQKKWEFRLTDLIEKEIELASGKKSKVHFSGDCKMNSIIELVKKEIIGARMEIIEEIEEIDDIYNKDQGIRYWQDIKIKLNRK